MIRGFPTVLLVFLAVGATIASAQDYGSYVAVCNTESSVLSFVNFPLSGCRGNSTLFTEVLNTCETETYQGQTYGWNAFCNSTIAVYNNFDDGKCAGQSALSRCYKTMTCCNCNNAICKDTGVQCTQS